MSPNLMIVYNSNGIPISFINLPNDKDVNFEDIINRYSEKISCPVDFLYYRVISVIDYNQLMD
jgi:hypothetical protein